MAYLTVDKDGSEVIWNCYPLRDENKGIWASIWSNCGEHYDIELPKGTIEKLIEWQMTWEHEPYELEEE